MSALTIRPEHPTLHPTPPSNPRVLRTIAATLATTIEESGWLPSFGIGLGLQEQDLWRDLTACILGSQVRHDQMQNALRNLSVAGLDRPWLIGATKTELMEMFQSALTRNESKGYATGYRFPSRGAALLAGAADIVYHAGCSLASLIRSLTPELLRRELAENIPGIGPKQSSLFIMGLGLSRDMASIDRHVLRYMQLTRCADESVWVVHCPKSPSDLSSYESIENELRADATSEGVCLASFDLAVWVLMRTCHDLAIRSPSHFRKGR
jgi:N-glycosylase/DNA lyase